MWLAERENGRTQTNLIKRASHIGPLCFLRSVGVGVGVGVATIEVERESNKQCSLSHTHTSKLKAIRHNLG